jgi:hypothetical protein
MGKISRVTILASCLLPFVILWKTANAFPQKAASPGELEKNLLGDILQKSGEYCARLEQIALFYVCLEAVEETIFNPFRTLEGSVGWWKTEKNRYLYDYQLIHKGNLAESRILLKMNGQDLNIKESPLKTKRFLYQHVIFGPLGIFGYEAQASHDYSVEKETKLWGVPVLVIKAVPKNPATEKWLYGKAWLDKHNGSILKTEWEERSVKNYEAMVEFAKSVRAEPGLKQESEYAIEKNGIRFPSEFKVREDYYQRRTIGSGVRVITKSILSVTYKDYKFFTVETESGIKK